MAIFKKENSEYNRKKAFVKDEITGKVRRYFGKTVEKATVREIYQAVAFTIRDEIMEKYVSYKEAVDSKPIKELYYLSFEFLMGRAMGNNLMNIMETDVYRDALAELNVSLEDVEEVENDAGFGNGGLGRLAACFLDSLTNLELPAYGCGIRYEYGLFKQKIVDGYQIEMPDPWLQSGNVWDIARPEDAKEVHFGGRIEQYFDPDGRMRFKHVDYNTVIAEPYDMPITGFDAKTVNTLRLWKAVSPEVIDMSEFNRGEYAKAMENKELAEVISKVLYPEDNHYEGKLLRLKQQYFFVSATIQWILAKHKQKNLSLMEIPEYVQIHINDTHPTIAIPELMRILMDEEGLSWEDAWGIVGRTFAYTNHTILCEALEKWPMEMVDHLLPRLGQIIHEIDRRQRIDLWERFPGDQNKIEYMAVISHGQVSMANLCLTACHSINGVAALHTEILKKETFKDYYSIYPYKFKNMTNGVTFRRWLYKANPELSSLIIDSIGDGWIKDYTQLEKLVPFADDNVFRDKFAEIKVCNKEKLADYIQKYNAITVDPHSLFDVQIKRLHEYKRQLLKTLEIIYRYQKLMNDPDNACKLPTTYIFAAKAAPGYHMAKLIIKFINNVAKVVNNDPRTNGILKVVFIENYSVSIAEKIVAAANLSEQISTASKEASGTGNMKLMLNGALTIGTMDGANVEIREQVGDDNIFIFGLSSQEVLNIYARNHSPSPEIYATNPVVKSVVDTLIDGTFSDGDRNMFYDLYKSLVIGFNGFADNYLLLPDFESYLRANQEVAAKFEDKEAWNRSAVLNTARAGFFSSDRTIEDYNREIWHLR